MSNLCYVFRRMTSCHDILEEVPNVASPFGFEAYPFKIGWYNAALAHACFKLPYPDDTLAFILISTPQMFEKAFKPFVCRRDCLGPEDALDKCMRHHFQHITQRFPSHTVETIHDFELWPNRRPKVLVQTAGHVAGAVRLYQRSDLTRDPWEKSKKIYGVCVHPRYGGWFGLRGVVIFTDVLCPDLPQKECEDILPTDEERQELLERYNDRWRDWSFRDIVPVEEKYSEEQRMYFSTPPADRLKLISQIKDQASLSV